MGRKLFGGLFSSSQSSLACTCPELEMPGNLHLPWCVPKQMNVTEARKLSRLPQEEKTDSREQHLHSRASLGVRLRLELYSLPASPRSLSFMTHLNTNPHLWDCSGNLYEWIFSYRISICPPSSSFFFFCFQSPPPYLSPPASIPHADLTLPPSLMFSGPHTIHDLCHFGLKWSFSTLAAGRVLLQLFLWQEECSFCAEFNLKSASLLGRSRGLYTTPCFTWLNICSGWAECLVFNFFFS